MKHDTTAIHSTAVYNYHFYLLKMKHKAFHYDSPLTEWKKLQNIQNDYDYLF